MAKKRVHELAKQYSMPLPEVLKTGIAGRQASFPPGSFPCRASYVRPERAFVPPWLLGPVACT